MITVLKNIGRGYVREAFTRLSLKNKLQALEHKNPVLVYQMGKVGSSSVVDTLKKLDLGSPILHVHTLSPEHLKFAVNKQRNSISPFLHEHHITSAQIIKKMKKGIFPCRIITLTREPVARAISFLFEDLKKQAPGAIVGPQQLDRFKLEEALNNLLAGENGISDPTHWFDTELRDCMGIDVFSVPYNQSEGFSFIEKGMVRALVIRMEDLDQALIKGLGILLDMELKGIGIRRANVGNKKWYAEDLRFLKETYKVDPEPANKVFNTKYFKHFYPQEAEQYLARWT